MKSRYTTILFFALALISILSCNKNDGNDMDTNEIQTHFTINESNQEWLAPFSEANKMFTYKNTANETATIKVTYRNFPTSSSFADCQRNGGTFQCEYENATLEFSSDIKMHLTIWLFGEDRLTLNYSDDAGLTPEIIRYREDTNEFENPQSDNFDVNFISNYSFENSNNNAFTISNTTLDGLFGTTPPKSFIFIKGKGIVEWTDYTGETWTLEN